LFSLDPPVQTNSRTAYLTGSVSIQCRPAFLFQLVPYYMALTVICRPLAGRPLGF
jgi:hypothetical protein